MVRAMCRRPWFNTIGGRELSRLGPAGGKGLASAAARREDGSNNIRRRYSMKWERPAATDMRFGFEITMYIANR